MCKHAGRRRSLVARSSCSLLQRGQSVNSGMRPERPTFGLATDRLLQLSWIVVASMFGSDNVIATKKVTLDDR